MDPFEDQSLSIEDRVDNLISMMTLDEKTCQMATLYGFGRVMKDELPTEDWKEMVIKDGIGNIDEHLNGLAYHTGAVTEFSWPPSHHARAINEVQRFFVEETRLGIPVDFTNEGIRGLCHHGSTSFPSQLGVGATWDTDLVQQIGSITGQEARMLGYTNIYSPILDIARDPRWGRSVECYGEDPHLVTTLGLAMIKGLQSQNVVSTAKHFAMYSMPKGGRDGTVRTNPQVTERELHHIYLRPFREAVKKQHIRGVMSSYNDYNGIPISGSKYFLTELLRNDWGFNGYVVSDSWAVGGLEGRHHVTDNFKESSFRSVMAGLNIRTNFSPPEDFITPIRELVEEGRIPMEVIDERVKDILRVKFELGLFDQPYVPNPAIADQVIHNNHFESISLQASRESIVLLKNENQTLPLNTEVPSKILVTGPNAKAINHSISRYGPSHLDVVTVLQGIKNIVGKDTEVIYSRGCDFYDCNWPENELYEMPKDTAQQRMTSEATDLARDVDYIIAVMGDDETTVGESRSRTSLDLPRNQRDLLMALKKTGKPVILVLMSGRATTINWSDKYLPAIVQGWFPGEYGGQAIAEVLFGKYNPGGKLPVTFPKTVGQLPYNFPFIKSSQKEQPASGPSGSGKTRNDGALYPFGYGLSYTTFQYNNISIDTTDFYQSDQVTISFDLTNTGGCDGDEVWQLYFEDLVSSVVTYKQQLIAFDRVHLKVGETRTISVKISKETLSFTGDEMKPVFENGEFLFMVGRSSEDCDIQANSWLE